VGGGVYIGQEEAVTVGLGYMHIGVARTFEHTDEKPRGRPYPLAFPHAARVLAGFPIFHWILLGIGVLLICGSGRKYVKK
jgi:hypothetical protein